ncbi:MAG: ABC transporter ATP-binding protein/permease [Rhodospirillaceae bacterium]|nr:ABC transporter ATP-binding protein/permease [Rhodospirillaceae bacterium]
MDRNIFGFIWHYSKRQQILIALATIGSFPFLYYSLDLPAIIVDEAIGGEPGDFPVSLLGFEFGQITYLMVLSGLFLFLVCLNGAFKYYINVYRGIVGERLLRRLRHDLYFRILRFRLPHFRRVSQNEMIPIITGEVEPIGGFGGDAFALPVFQGGTLLVYLFFIFVQDFFLGLAAIALYPVQAWVIPKLQYHVNQLGKRRVRTIRQVADRIGETASGIQDIHAHGTAPRHLAEISHRLGGLYDIRLEIYRRKFFIKFLNNFLNQLTPFFFYAIGGYFVIVGELSFGALVAVLAAYKDLSGPWRELLNYYQQVEDVRIKYDQVVEQFMPADLQDADQVIADTDLDGPLPPRMSLVSVTLTDDSGHALLDAVTTTLDLTRTTAVLGDGSSGRSEFMQIIARLLLPTSGRVRLGEHDLADLAESITGRRFAYVGPAGIVFTGSWRDNLYYALQRRPATPQEIDEVLRAEQQRRITNARLTGNMELDYDADWIDYAAAGAAGPADLQARALAVVQQVDLGQDIFRMGLNGTIDAATSPDLADKVLEARRRMRARLADPTLADLVELFDRSRYNESASVAENVIFGTPVGPEFAGTDLAGHPHMRHVLDATGLTEDFLKIGLAAASTIIELFADLPPGHPFFDQYSFIASDDLPSYQPIVAAAQRDGVDALPDAAKRLLMSIPFALIVSRHRLDLIGPELQARLLEARDVFARDLPPALSASVSLFDAERYTATATIQDNLLFGKVRYGRSNAWDKVQALIISVVEECELREPIMAVGLDDPVGIGGGRLNPQQRQKLSLGRALMKRPEVLILDNATSLLDRSSQEKVHAAVDAAMAGRGLIWAPHRADLARSFDHVIVLKAGRLAGDGKFTDLEARGVLAGLLEG